jgi:hypothetical protein
MTQHYACIVNSRGRGKENLRRAEVKISGPAIHQAPQTGFGIAATDGRGAGPGCIFARSPRPVFE